MKNRVLVAYASKYGSTAEIAQKIGQVLQQAGLTVDVLPVDEKPDPTDYDAIVLGSAVYMGRWLKRATNYLKDNEGKLVQRPVWIFSSGPTGEGDTTQLLSGWRYPDYLQPHLDQIQPRDITIFHGELDPEKVNFFERTIIKNVGAPVGDYRVWESVTGWATAIATSLTTEPIAT